MDQSMPQNHSNSSSLGHTNNGGVPPRSGPVPQSTSISSARNVQHTLMNHSRDPHRSNEILFAKLRKELADGRITVFTAAVNMLKTWLADERAYYTQARPVIVELMEIAHATIRRISNVPANAPFHMSQCPGELQAWANAFNKVFQIVHRFGSYFTEPDLQARLNVLGHSFVKPGSVSTPQNAYATPVTPSSLPAYVQPSPTSASPVQALPPKSVSPVTPAPYRAVPSLSVSMPVQVNTLVQRPTVSTPVHQFPPVAMGGQVQKKPFSLPRTRPPPQPVPATASAPTPVVVSPRPGISYSPVVPPTSVPLTTPATASVVTSASSPATTPAPFSVVTPVPATIVTPTSLPTISMSFLQKDLQWYKEKSKETLKEKPSSESPGSTPTSAKPPDYNPLSEHLKSAKKKRGPPGLKVLPATLAVSSSISSSSTSSSTNTTPVPTVSTVQFATPQVKPKRKGPPGLKVLPELPLSDAKPQESLLPTPDVEMEEEAHNTPEPVQSTAEVSFEAEATSASNHTPASTSEQEKPPERNTPPLLPPTTPSMEMDGEPPITPPNVPSRISENEPVDEDVRMADNLQSDNAQEDNLFSQFMHSSPQPEVPDVSFLPDPSTERFLSLPPIATLGDEPEPTCLPQQQPLLKKEPSIQPPQLSIQIPSDSQREEGEIITPSVLSPQPPQAVDTEMSEVTPPSPTVVPPPAHPATQPLPIPSRESPVSENQSLFQPSSYAITPISITKTESPANVFLFGPELTILGYFVGKKELALHWVKLLFEINGDLFTQLTCWTRRHLHKDDVSNALCITLASYPSGLISEQLQNNPHVVHADMFKDIMPTEWQHQRVHAVQVNESGFLPLTPPFVRTKDHLYDISHWIKEGSNVLEFYHHGALEDYIFVALLHTPTASQLREIQEEREREKEWKDSLKRLSTFADVPPIPVIPKYLSIPMVPMFQS